MSVRSARGLRAPSSAWLLRLSIASVSAGGCAARPVSPPAYPPQQVEPAPPAPADPDEKPDPTVPRALGWFAIALGAEGAIAATATSALMLGYKSTRDSGCNAAKLCSAAGLNADQQIGSLAGWNAGAFVLAAAGLGAGSLLLLTHPLGKERRASVTLAPTGTVGGLGLSGSF